MYFEDFNNLPDLIVEKVFECLESDDVLNTMLVSKAWHNYCASNSSCMNKLRLKIEGWQDLEIVTSVLQKNARNYSSIYLNNLNPSKEFAYLSSGKNWKSVSIEQMKFSSQSEFWKYLSQFGDRLEVLEIEKIIIAKEDSMGETLKLPRLKSLILKQVPTTSFVVFDKSAHLKTLHFDIPAFGTKTRSFIIDFFEKFRSGKIEDLQIARNSLYGLSMKDVASIESIIMSMSCSLKKLELKDWGCCHTFHRIWNQLKVSHFSIHFCSRQPDIENIHLLMPNQHLRVLELSLIYVLPIKWVKQLFLLTPYLEDIFMTRIRKEVVYYAAHSLHKLKTFRYVSCIIDIAKTEITDPEEIDEFEIREMHGELPENGSYDYLGENELFNLTGNLPRGIIVERYSDYRIKKSFASLYYNSIKGSMPVNRCIEFQKCAKK